MTHSPPAELPDVPGARHLGDLTRSSTTWRVYFEVDSAARPVKGRVHFVSAGGQRSTGWIFLEYSEPDLLKRFQEFSAVELWKILDSLD
jgi:hypothetical protein